MGAFLWPAAGFKIHPSGPKPPLHFRYRGMGGWATKAFPK